MKHELYDSTEHRSLIEKFLKEDRQNSQRLKQQHPEFLIWLTITYADLAKSEALHQYLFGEPASTSCQACGGAVKFNGLWKGYAKYCSYICSNKDEAKQQKVKATLLANYGVDNPSKDLSIREKKVATNLERYGARHFMCTEDGKDAVKTANQKRYGVDWFVQSDDFQKAYTANSQEKYGVNRPQQTGEYWENRKKYGYKEHQLSNNETVLVQGYDGFLIDYLLMSGYVIADIGYTRTDVPTIRYEFDGSRVYFPDAYVAKTNTVYEAKSEWTYSNDVERVTAKIEAAKASGFNVVCIIFDNTGRVLRVI